MQTMLKGLMMGLVVASLSLTTMAAKAKGGSEKEFTFKGKLEAVKVVVDKQNAEKVTAKVAIISEGKEIVSEKVVLKQNAKNKEIWAGEFTVKAKVAEKAAVKVQATGEATLKAAKARKLEGDKKVTVTKDIVEVGMIKLVFAKKK
jgi:hypothetical protein